jgi:hypothetical protein
LWPPSLVIEYDCESNVANLIVEWMGTCSAGVVAEMYIDFDANEEYLWQLQVDRINESKLQTGAV